MCRPSRAVSRLLLVVAVLGAALGRSSSRADALTFTVDSTVDAGDADLGDGICADADGDCTLRAAVEECDDESTEACTIDVPAGTYLLTGHLFTDSAKSLAIVGEDPDTTILDAQNNERVFAFGGPPIALANLTLQHASVVSIGGGGQLTLTNCQLVDSAASLTWTTFDGTGLTIIDSILEGPATFKGPTSVTGSTLRHGEFAFPSSSLAHTIVDSTLQNGIFRCVDGPIKISDCSIEDSWAQVIDDNLTVENSTAVRSHFSAGEAGGIGIMRSSVTGYAGPGCAISANSSLSIEDSEISDNGGCGVSRGGWISGGNAGVRRSRILRNGGTGLSVSGHGTSSSLVTIVDSVIAGNQSGGVEVLDGNKPPSVVIENSTLANNSTPANGGGLRIPGNGAATTSVQLRNVTVSGNIASGSGGGIFASGGSLSLSNVTLENNVADADDNGSGDGGGLAVTTAAVTMRNTLIGDNVDEGHEADGCNGTVTSAGYNLLAQGGCTLIGDLTGNIIGVDPQLGVLDDNGGPTPTHALLPSSPAKNAGNPAGCARDDGTLLATDQRGVSRPQFGRCDIGAFEATCGNGTVELGETCDDGNTADGDCCSNLCQLDDDGTACNDGNVCTTGNTCSEGVCGAGTPVTCAACETCVPATGCALDVRPACHATTARFAGELALSSKGARTVKWQWTKGAATTLADFGNPTAGGTYALCVFDESGATPTVAFRAATRTGTCGSKPCWKQTNSKTFQYKDLQSGGDGLQTLQLRAGAAGKAKILLTGKGPALSLPTFPLDLPLRAQLHAPNGQCWETRHFEVGLKRNDATTFKAQGYQP